MPYTLTAFTSSLQLIPYVAKEKGTSPYFSTDYSYCGNAEFVHPPQDDHPGAVINEKEFQTLPPTFKQFL